MVGPIFEPTTNLNHGVTHMSVVIIRIDWYKPLLSEYPGTYVEEMKESDVEGQ